MKQVGIVTLYLFTNYGGILQAWALQQVLSRLGHKPVTIQVLPFQLPGLFTEFIFIFIKLIQRCILRKQVTSLFPFREFHAKMKRKEMYTRQFIDKNINTLEIKAFSDVPNKFDSLIVGSDQVWRPKYYGYGKIAHAYLKFASDWNVRRLSYGASFGTDKWEYSDVQTQECCELAHRFDAVSVREKSAIKLAKEYLGVQAQQVLDPTMLLDKEDYEQLVIAAGEPISDGDLFCYVLDKNDEIETLIETVANQQGLKPFYIGVSENIPDYMDFTQPPVEKWLRAFMDARFVITDSFHACVFSILFHKPFIVMGNEGRGNTRFDTLLNMFGLTDRLVTDGQVRPEHFEPLPASVYEKLDEWRQSSLAFIKDNI